MTSALTFPTQTDLHDWLSFEDGKFILWLGLLMEHHGIDNVNQSNRKIMQYREKDRHRLNYYSVNVFSPYCIIIFTIRYIYILRIRTFNCQQKCLQLII